MTFKYLRDPLFVCCVVAYFVNRWLLKPLFPHGFFHDSLNDLICIPFWVPIMLWGVRSLKVRADDAPPQWYEIVIPLIMWSIVFEMVLPHMKSFRHIATADHMDILWYTIGALVASLFWKVWYSAMGKRSSTEV